MTPKQRIETKFEMKLPISKLFRKVFHKVFLIISDGQVHDDRLRPRYYPDPDVFLVCFSVDMYDSFENIKQKWAPHVSCLQ